MIVRSLFCVELCLRLSAVCFLLSCYCFAMLWVDTPPKDSDTSLINYLQNCYNTEGHNTVLPFQLYESIAFHLEYHLHRI